MSWPPRVVRWSAFRRGSEDRARSSEPRRNHPTARPTPAAEDVGLTGVAEAVLDVGEAGGGEPGDDGVARQEMEAPAPGLPLQPTAVAPHAEGVLEVAQRARRAEQAPERRQADAAP